MAKITKHDKEDFALYLKQCTDNQVRGVWEKEKQANRRVYTQLAKEEALRRGIEL